MNAIIATDVAIPVAEALVEAQRSVADPIHHLGAQADWVSPENLRLNLLWLPELDEGALPRLISELRMMSRTLPEARLQLRGLRFDPEPSCPRRILADVVEGRDEMEALERRLDTLATHLGLRARGKWNASVTLAMLRTPAGPVDLRGVLGGWADRDFGSSVVRELMICSAEASEHGVRASVRARIAFGSGM